VSSRFGGAGFEPLNAATVRRFVSLTPPLKL